MFRRFVSGSAIASIGIAVAVLVILLTHGLAVQRFYPLMTMWCFAPLVWGLWAVFAPSGWVPQRLPIWGGILGLIAALLAAFVLDLPLRVLGVAVPVILRGVAVVVMAVFYYFLWMLVRVAYRSLGTPTSVE
jgi:drug/metabolite transporter (DMT)-like permease